MTTAEATDAEAAAERIAADITLVVGKKKTPIDTKKLRPWITFATTADGGYAPVVDTTKLPTLLDGLATKIDKKAINATFRTSGSRITGVEASKDGYKLDASRHRQADRGPPGRPGDRHGDDRDPARADGDEAGADHRRGEGRRAQDAQDLGLDDLLPDLREERLRGEHLDPGADDRRLCRRPAREVRFLGCRRDVSRAKGYRLGGAIINGRTEPQGALAGGICSCSTTLFNAALRAGFDMGARRNHYYYIDRYPLGLDATVFKSGSARPRRCPGPTTRTTRCSSAATRSGTAAAATSGSTCTASRTAARSRSAHRSSGTSAAPSDTVQYTSSLPPGSTKRIEFPVDGKQVWRTVTVRDTKGKLLHRRTYYSNYPRITGVVLVGRSAD